MSTPTDTGHDTQLALFAAAVAAAVGVEPSPSSPGNPLRAVRLDRTTRHSYRPDCPNKAKRGPERIAELFEIAGQERAAIARLINCVAQLHAVQDAKDDLGRLSPVEVRAALERRHLALVQPSHDEASPTGRGA